MASSNFLSHCSYLLMTLYLLPVIEAVSQCDSNDGIRSPSLYEQYCCVESNREKSFVLTNNEDNYQYILCPPETPASCSFITFSPSCSAILTNHPSATSGYYNIMLANGTVITAYCDMEGVNCDGEGGWMRVAYLNMSDPSEQCPPGFKLYEMNGVRACGRQSGPGCQSITFFSYNISYIRVCGRVTGYQKGSPDAISAASYTNINQAYVDGVSITQGNTREHIWTFIAAIQENFLYINGDYVCPCAPNSPLSPQSFMGNDYFCESGQPGNWPWDSAAFLTADPLWDGKQCGLIEEACCNVTGIPWFNKILQQPTTDYIELRVCGDEDIDNEDTPVDYYEILVK